MPPKKKKGGKKSGGGGKKGKKGKNKEPEITFQEAILAYRIGLVEKQIEDWKFEENNLEEQKERLTERNERLLEEQKQYTKLLLKQSKEFEKKNLSAEKIGKEHVMRALAEKWDTCKDEDKKLEEMQADIFELEKTILRTRRERNRWIDYKNMGSVQRTRQIELLEKELKDMKQSYLEMTEHLSRNLDVSRERIVTHMEKTLNNQKHSASDKAMATLDKKDRQEVLDNEWMKDELKRYEEQCGVIQEEVEVIERENLTLMSELFDCNVDDLKITRNLFLTQFGDDETLADGGILQVDLKQVSLLEREKNKTSLQKFEAPTKADVLEQLDEDYDEYDEYYDDRSLTPSSDSADPFNNYYNFDDEDIEEYLELGPLQLKLLSLSGERKPIYVQGGTTSEEVKAKQYNPDEWPVTQPMMKSVATPRDCVY